MGHHSQEDMLRTAAAELPVLDGFSFGRSKLGLAGLSKRALLTIYLLRWRRRGRPQYKVFKHARRQLWQISQEYETGAVDALVFVQRLFGHLEHVADTTADLLSEELDSPASVALKLLWQSTEHEPEMKVLVRDEASEANRAIRQLPNFYPYSANTAFRHIVATQNSYFVSDDLKSLFENGDYDNTNRIWQELYDRTAVSAVPPIDPGRVPISGFLCADSLGGSISSAAVKETLEMASYHVYTTLRLLYLKPANAEGVHGTWPIGFQSNSDPDNPSLVSVAPEAQGKFQEVVEHVEHAFARNHLETSDSYASSWRSQNRVKPSPGANDSSQVEGKVSSGALKGTGQMKEFYQHIEEIGRRGEAIYESVKEMLEKEHLGEFVVVNVKSGKYVLGSTSREAWSRYKGQFGEAASWETQIGDPGYVMGGGRVLQ